MSLFYGQPPRYGHWSISSILHPSDGTAFFCRGRHCAHDHTCKYGWSYTW